MDEDKARAAGNRRSSPSRGGKQAGGSSPPRGRKQAGAPAAPPGDAPEVLAGYYRQMALIKTFELRADEMYKRNKIGGYCHLNLGEEATVVGLAAALERRDFLFTTYREHGYALALGISPGRVMAELFGRATGVSGGWGGSMHLFDAEARLLGGYGIVGGQLPPATGAALAIAYRGEGGPETEAVMALMGDATTNIGAFHESLNLAAIWQLPIVYVVINNGLGMGTPVAAASGEPELYKRGCAYRIPGVRVDGSDPLAVRDAAREALRSAREDRQPVLLETVSVRIRGHSVIDFATYRSDEEKAALRTQDPVAAFREKLIGAGILDEKGAEQIEAEAEQAVSAAVAFADSSPAPDLGALFDNSYATPVPSSPRQLPGEAVVATGETRGH